MKSLLFFPLLFACCLRRATTSGSPEVLGSPEALRLLYCITAYDRKQHVHLLQLIASAVSMCEGGLSVMMIIYHSDGLYYTTDEAAEMRELAAGCTRPMMLHLELRAAPASLRLEVTMLHRKDMAQRLEDFDVFVYAEDDSHIELRHVTAYVAGSRKLAQAPDGDRYLLGWQRYEHTGIGLGATQVSWENGIDSWHAVEIGGELYAMTINPHAGAWIATREELRQLNAKCRFFTPGKTAGSFTRVRAAGWNMYHNCGRRKVLPVTNIAAFLIHHLPDKNWWQRSACAVELPLILSHLRDWQKRFSQGDRGMLCGNWWEDDFCRNRKEVLSAKLRRAKYGLLGSCTVWRDKVTGVETVTQPNAPLTRLASIIKAEKAAGKKLAEMSPSQLENALQAP